MKPVGSGPIFAAGARLLTSLEASRAVWPREALKAEVRGGSLLAGREGRFLRSPLRAPPLLTHSLEPAIPQVVTSISDHS
jgi:hypothetical protein